MAARESGPRGSLARAALALVVVWALTFAPQIFSGRGFVLGDTANLRAFADFSRQRWEEHRERAHWNPYVFAGIPATVSLQDSRPQWLPDRLLDAFDGVHRLPGVPPLAIPMLLHLAGMIAAAALARELWGARTVTLAVVGIAWGLQPNLLVPFAFGHDAQLMASAMIPAMVLAVVRLQRAGGAPSPWIGVLALAVTVALTVLAAHPQVAVFALALAAAFALERAARARSWEALVAPGAGITFGLALSAAVWVPAWLYTAHTVRGAAGIGLSEVATWSAGVLDLAALAWPWAGGFGGATYFGGLRANDFPQYAGLIVCALAIAGLARRRDGEDRSAALLVACAVVAALLALGTRLGPAYTFLHEHVPLFSAFRIAVNALLVTQFALAMLAGRGLERLLEDRASQRWAGRAAVIALVAGVAFSLAVVAGPDGGMYGAAFRGERPSADPAVVERAARTATRDLVTRTLLLALGLGSLAAGSGVGAVALPLLVAVDLGSVDVPFLRRATGDLGRLGRAPPAVARLVAADPLHRAVVPRRDLFFANDWIAWRARSLAGFHPAVPRAWDELRRLGLLGHVPMLRALAVGYVAGGGFDSADTTRFERIEVPRAFTTVDPPDAWRLRGALPRAYAASEVLGLARDADVLGVLATAAFDPRRRSAKVGNRAAGKYPGSADCELRWHADAPDHIEIDVRAEAPAFLVVADTWLPGWTAAVDGNPAPLHRVNHILRGVAVPGGAHRLTLRYVPEGWRVSVAVSRTAFAAWIVLVAAAATAGLRRRKRPPAAIASTPATPSGGDA